MIQYLVFFVLIAVSVPAEIPKKTLLNAVPLKNLGGRVIGGNQATIGQFPYQAALVIQVSSEDAIFCGGSLITQTFVLTAGHCTISAIQALAFFGSINTPTDPNEAHYTSKKITTHPSFSMETLSDDIGIIELSSAVRLTSNVNLISLDYERLNENVQVTISGFGKTNDDVYGTISTVLRYTSLTTITNTECDLTFNSVSSGIVCAKGTAAQSACSGDSGGPLTRTNGTDVVQVAIVSFVSIDGCTLGRPSGFTRVANYKQFIEGVLNSSTSYKIIYTLEVCLLFFIYLLNQ